MTCKHLNTRLDSDSLTSAMICPQCGKTVRVYQLVNNMLNAMQDSIKPKRRVPRSQPVEDATEPEASDT